jgi:hypothetical protein
MANGVDGDGVQLSFLGDPSDALSREALAGKPGRERMQRGRWVILRRLAAVVGIVALVSALAFVQMPELSLFARVHVAVLALLPFTLWRLGVLALTMRRLKRLRRAAGQSRHDGWNQVVISPKGLVWAGETHQEYVSWQGVADVRMDPGLGIWFDCGRAEGLLIPIRVFSDKEDYAEVCRVIGDARQARTAPAHLVPRDAPEQAEMPIVLH